MNLCLEQQEQRAGGGKLDLFNVPIGPTSGAVVVHESVGGEGFVSRFDKGIGLF